jgi:hypothetical protein
MSDGGLSTYSETHDRTSGKLLSATTSSATCSGSIVVDRSWTPLVSRIAQGTPTLPYGMPVLPLFTSQRRSTRRANGVRMSAAHDPYGCGYLFEHLSPPRGTAVHEDDLVVVARSAVAEEHVPETRQRKHDRMPERCQPSLVLACQLLSRPDVHRRCPRAGRHHGPW